jgi:hypothetical protein
LTYDELRKAALNTKNSCPDCNKRICDDCDARQVWNHRAQEVQGGAAASGTVGIKHRGVRYHEW